MHPMEALVANKVVFAAIVLTALLLYLAVAFLFWSRAHLDSGTAAVPPEPMATRSPEDDPAAIAGEISANLEKLLSEQQRKSIDKDALLRKLLRSERFKG